MSNSSSKTYTELELRIFPYNEAQTAYPVEAELDDGSRFDDGQLKLDRDALLAQQLDPEGYGLALFNALFPPGGVIRRAYDIATGKAEADSGGRLRVRLWIEDEAVELHALPWERLYHQHEGRVVPLSTSALTPLSRYTSLEIREPLPITDTPIQMLVAVSNPTNLPGGLAPANVDLEIENLRRSLSDLQRDGKVHVTVMAGRTGLSAALRARLEEEGYAIVEGVTNLFNIAPHLAKSHVFHFIGHGAFKGGGGRGAGDGEAGSSLATRHSPGVAALYLEKADGTWQATRDEEIASMFTVLGTLPHLVFLVACESAKREAGAASPFVGLGPKLVQAGIPAVVAMQEQVPVELARILSGEFYARLAEHGEVDRALNQARAQVFDRKSIEWAIPVLFMRIRKGRLFGADPDDDAPAPGEPPFKGLQYFTEKDAEKFYGREHLTARLVGKLRLSRFLPVIVGASGSGKSSVVRAGVIPALKRGEALIDGTLPPDGSRTWPMYVLTPSATPLESLAAALTRESESLTATTTLMEDLRVDERALHLRSRKLLAERPGANRALIIVDQFEEIFTLCKDEDQRRAFINNLLYASSEKTDGPTVVIIIFRADFYAHCAQYANLRAAVSTHQEFVGPMNQDELRRAIEEPAKAGGWDFEPGLVDLILKEVGDEPGALPLMQHALLETWKRRRGRTMTLRGYNDAGGIRGAIAKTAEIIYKELPADQQLMAKRIFLRLVELGEGTQDTRRRALLEELSPKPEDRPLIDIVLKKLTDNRLVVTTATTAEVAHEALIREWPTFREWINQNREALRIHRDLGEAAREWDNLLKETGVLYRGVKLVQAVEWADEHGEDMNELEAEYLHASKTEVEREAREKEEQQERELAAAKKLADEQARVAEAAQKLAEAEKQRAAERAEADRKQLETAQKLAEAEKREAAERAEADRKQLESARKSRRNFLVFGIVAVVLAVVSLIAFGFAADARNKAYVASTHAVEKEQIAVTERANADVQRATADAASTKAVEQRATAQAASTQAVAEREKAEEERQRALGRQLAAQGVSLSGERLDISLLLSAEGYQVENTLEAHDSLLRTLSLSPRLRGYRWDLPNNVTTLALTPDNQTLVVVASGRLVQLWDVAEARLVNTLLAVDETEAFSAHPVIALFPDGQTLIISFCHERDEAFNCVAGEMQFWDISAPASARQLGDAIPLPGTGVESLTLGANGSLLAAVYSTYVIQLWEVSNPANPQAQGETFHHSEQGTGVVLAALHPTEPLLATATCVEVDEVLGFDCLTTELRLWNVANPTTPEWFTSPADEGTASFNTMFFSPDGRHLVINGFRQLQVWDVSELGQPFPLGDALDNQVALAFSPSGEDIVTAQDGGQVQLWDITRNTPQVLGPALRGHPGAVYAAAFTANGQALLTAGTNQALTFWDVADPLVAPVLGARLAAEASALDEVFHPTAPILITSDFNGAVSFWDIRQPFAPAVLGPPINTGLSGVYLAVSADGQVLATSSPGHRIMLWDMSATQLDQEPALRELGALPLLPSEGGIGPVAFSPSARVLAVGDASGAVQFWDVADAAAPQWLGEIPSEMSAGIYSLRFSADGHYLGTVGQNFTVWDVSNWATPQRFSTVAVSGFLASADFNMERQLVVTLNSEGLDSGLWLWDISNPASPTVIGTLLRGENISSVAISPDVALSPDGSTVVIGGEATMQLWSVSDPTNPRPLGTALNKAGSSFAFSPDGQLLTSHDFDSAILWPIGPEALRQRACELVGRNFTQAEWRRYLNDAPYRVTCEQWPAGE